MGTDQQRRLAFGAVAELYDTLRPSYPAALVDDVVTLSAAARALEVGAGTGKATRLFADRGVEIHALEPSAAMAAVARERCSAYPHVTIEEVDFERFSPSGGRFGLLFSAQAWHWVAPELRYLKAREALAHGGVLALFWNRPRWNQSPLRAALVDAYARAAPAFGPGSGPGPMHPGIEDPLGGEFERELLAAPRFNRAQVRSYEWRCSYTAEDYVRLLQTHSDHMFRPESERTALFEGVREVIEQAGGSLEVHYATVLGLAVAA